VIWQSAMNPPLDHEPFVELEIAEQVDATVEGGLRHGQVS